MADNDLMATIAALSGLGLNIAGAVSNKGAVGNGVLNAAQNMQERSQKLAEKAKKDLADKEAETNNTAILESLTDRINKAPIEAQPFLKAQVEAGADSDKVHAQLLNYERDALNRADRQEARQDRAEEKADKKTLSDASKMASSIGIIEGNLKKLHNPLDVPEKIQNMLVNAADIEGMLSSQGNFNTLAAQAGVKNPGGYKGRTEKALYSEVLDYVNSKKQGGVLGFFKKLPKTDREQLFSDFVSTQVSPQAMDVGGLLKDQLAVASGIKSTLKNPYSAARGLELSKVFVEAQQALNSNDNAQRARGIQAIQKLKGDLSE